MVRFGTMRRFVRASALAGGIASLVLAGCGESGPTTAPVSGVVLVDGQPVEGVQVFFSTDAVAATATTDPSGRFELKPGAQSGKNKVWLRKFVGGDPELQAMDAEQIASMRAAGVNDAKIPKPLLPPKYAEEAQTVLSVDVPAEGLSDAKIEAGTK